MFGWAAFAFAAAFCACDLCKLWVGSESSGVSIRAAFSAYVRVEILPIFHLVRDGGFAAAGFRSSNVYLSFSFFFSSFNVCS
jgi:hypothetical protein